MTQETVTFDIDQDGNAEEVAGGPAPVERKPAIEVPPQEENAPEREPAIPSENDEEPQGGPQEIVEEQDDEDSAEDQGGAQEQQPAVQQQDNLKETLTELLTPLIDGLTQQKNQQTQAQEYYRITDAGMKAKQKKATAKEAIKKARNPQAEKKAWDDYDQATNDLKAAHADAQEYAKKYNIQPEGGKSTEGENETGGKPAEGGKPAIPQEGTPAFQQAEAKIKSWMDANKAWFNADDEDHPNYMLSVATIMQSEKLMQRSDLTKEQRDPSNDAHWDMVDEFVRKKTGQSKSKPGAGGAQYTQPPVDTSQGSNSTPVPGSTTKKKRVSVPKADLDRILKAKYGTTNRDNLTKEQVNAVIRHIKKNKGNYK